MRTASTAAKCRSLTTVAATFSSRKRRTRSPSRARRRIWSHAGLPGYLKVPPMEIQVLCPMKRGSAGTASLNRILQEKLNPPSRDKKGSAAGGHTLPRGRQSDADAEQLPAGMGADERRQGGDWHGSVQRRHRSNCGASIRRLCSLPCVLMTIKWLFINIPT